MKDKLSVMEPLLLVVLRLLIVGSGVLVLEISFLLKSKKEQSKPFEEGMAATID